MSRWIAPDDNPDLTGECASIAIRLLPVVEPFDGSEKIRTVMYWDDEEKARQYLTAMATADFHHKTNGELEEVGGYIDAVSERKQRTEAVRKLRESERDLVRPYRTVGSETGTPAHEAPVRPAPPPWNGPDRVSALTAGAGALLMPVVGFTAIGLMVHSDPRVGLVQGVVLAGIAVAGQMLPKIRHDQLRSEDERDRYRRRLNTAAKMVATVWVGMLCLTFGESFGGDGTQGGNTSETVSRLFVFSTIIAEGLIGAVCYIACQQVAARHLNAGSLVRNKDRETLDEDVQAIVALEERDLGLSGKLKARKVTLEGLLALHTAPVLGEYENVRAAIRPLTRKPTPAPKGGRFSKPFLNGGLA